MLGQQAWAQQGQTSNFPPPPSLPSVTLTLNVNRGPASQYTQTTINQLADDELDKILSLYSKLTDAILLR